MLQLREGTIVVSCETLANNSVSTISGAIIVLRTEKIFLDSISLYCSVFFLSVFFQYIFLQTDLLYYGANSKTVNIDKFRGNAIIF